LEIAVFRVPELSKTVKVTASGQIEMPLIGTVQAGGKTIPELQNEIATKLEAKYLQTAEVSVFVTEANSQKVTVDGAVQTPGMVTITGQTTLLQTIAMSGGLAQNADPTGIIVFRTVNQQRSAAKFDLKAIRAGRADDPVLFGGDVVVVDTSAFGSAWAGVRNALPAVGVFTAMGAL
jgi:polysaccharide export outer membrane protein